MALLFADPFDALLRFQKSLDSLRSSPWLDAGPSGSGAYPPVNVFRRGDDVVLIAEVPGVKKTDLRIEVKGRTVRISGTKSLPMREATSVHRRERLAGSFDRALTLPVEINADQVKAEYRDGILALHLPRSDRDKPRSIAIS
jgi:HSP20 family protein